MGCMFPMHRYTYVFLMINVFYTHLPLSIIVTGFWKTDQVVIFSILRNMDFKINIEWAVAFQWCSVAMLITK